MADKTVFNISPYYDDYNEDKNFLRMLFRPGYAVQARELTQAQTILQNQVQRFGDHVFEDGSRVMGAGIVNRPVSFIRLEKNYWSPNGTSVPTDLTKILDYELIERTGGIDGINNRAKVIHAVSPTDEDPYYITFIEFLTGSSFTDGCTIESTILSEDYVVQAATAGGQHGGTVNGKSNLVSVDEGVFYSDGFFIKNQKSHVSPFNIVNIDGKDIRVFENPYARVGFKMEAGNVTSSEDETLRDPASGTYNFNAPGADRYRIKLNLDFKEGSTGSAQDFIELMKFDSGNITYKLNKTNYSELEKTLARRTYDESGSYTVRPFDVDIREHLIEGDNRGVYSEAAGGSVDKLAVGLLPGKAYVFGNEYETQTTEYLTVKKARQTDGFSGGFNFNHGNYFVAELGNTSDVVANGGGGGYWLYNGGIDSNDINKKPVSVILASNDNGSNIDNPSTLGTAKIHKVDRNSDGNFRVYVYNIKLENTAFINQVDSVYCPQGSNHTDTSASTRLIFKILDNSGVGPGGTGPHGRDENILVFPLKTGSAIKSLTKIKYSFKKRITTEVETTSSGGQLDFTLTSGLNLKFDNNVNDIGKFFVFENVLDADNTSGQPIARTTLVSDPSITKIDDVTVRVSGLDFNPATDSGTHSYYLIATVLSDDSTGQNANSVRRKTLNTGASAGFSAGVAGQNVYEGVSKLTRVEDFNGSVYYEIPNHDVYKITAIDGTSADELNSTVQESYDPSGDFLFDNGQRDNEYLNSRVYLRESVKNHYGVDGASSPNLVVHYEHFNHSQGPGPFSIDSYTLNGFTYDDVPLYTSKNLRKTFSLSSCLDFRHSPQTNTNNQRIPDTKSSSSALTTMQGEYDYYLSRVDKIVINNDLNGDVAFSIIEGVDAIVPKPPSDRENSMTLYSITVPAYTHNPNDVGIKLIDNKRYTMKDLGKVENRINDLEYYTTLSLLENEIDSRVLYSAGSTTDSAFKNGILVDGFRGHNIGDVSHVDYKCSIDYEKGHLRPSFKPTEIKLNTSESYPSGLQLSDDGILTFSIGSTTDYINQPSSNISLKINPFNLANWVGTVTLSPPIGNWFDTSVRPTVRINSQGENDNWRVCSVNSTKGYGTQWNDWESIWYGIDVVDDNLLDDRKGNIFLNQARVKNSSFVVSGKTENNISSVTRDATTTREEKNRVGLNIRNIPEHLKTKINDKIVDRSVVPFIKEQTITASARGLKPHTQVWSFFDNVNVDNHCQNSSGVSGPFITDKHGNLNNITFYVPSSKFETGEKVFRFIDDSDGRILNATTSADGVFYSHGISRKREGSIVSTRPVHLRRITANSEKVIKNPHTRDKTLNISKYTNWLDPMSQNFYVDDVSYPSGIFLDSVEVYFSAVDETIPVKLDIRQTVNGTPSPSVVVPFSEIYKSGTGEGLTYDAGTAILPTNFNFSSPVFLEPGEYSICLSSNSSNFEVHAGRIGENSIDGFTRIINPIYSGAVYHSSNNRTAEADNTLNIKYKLNRCNFNASTSQTVTFKNKGIGEVVNIDSYRLNVGSATPIGTSLKHIADFDNNTNIIENQNNHILTTQTLAANETKNMVSTTFSLDNPAEISAISPVVDVQYSNVIAIANQINTLSGDADETIPFGNESSASAKYISRRVTLEDGFEAKNIKVFLDANKQGATSDIKIDVYIKTSTSTTEEEFDDVGYVKMDVENSSDEFISTNQFDFREISYTLPVASIPIESQDKIKSFAVKVCSYSNNSANVPLIKDLRIVALDS